MLLSLSVVSTIEMKSDVQNLKKQVTNQFEGGSQRPTFKESTESQNVHCFSNIPFSQLAGTLNIVYLVLPLSAIVVPML